MRSPAVDQFSAISSRTIGDKIERAIEPNAGSDLAGQAFVQAGPSSQRPANQRPINIDVISQDSVACRWRSQRCHRRFIAGSAKPGKPRSVRLRSRADSEADEVQAEEKRTSVSATPMGGDSAKVYCLLLMIQSGFADVGFALISCSRTSCVEFPLAGGACNRHAARAVLDGELRAMAIRLGRRVRLQQPIIAMVRPIC